MHLILRIRGVRLSANNKEKGDKLSLKIRIMEV